MPIDFDIGDGADALGRNQLSDALDGTYWVSGWDWSLGTGDLEVDIAAGEGAINGGDVSTGSTQTVDFTGDVDATDPRKAVISVDDTGTVQKTLGTAVPAAPTDEVRFRTYDPAPPTNAPGVVVAEVWLAAGTTSLVSDDVRDRRVSNDAVEAVQPEPNTPDWEEDGNSPIQITNETSYTYTLSESYDRVMVIGFVESIDDDLQIRINGLTTSYVEFLLDGTDGGDSDQITVFNSDFGKGIRLIMEGRWDGRWAMINNSMSADLGVTTRARNNSANSPLTDIEFFSATGSINDIRIEVYGRNIG